ncbi:MAG: thermonuclease family protein [Rhizobium sp.]|uniref:thermonuclease family protein n=1 Tax=Rhizobium sp. TaxID=391 RepID=UPI0030F28CC8
MRRSVAVAALLLISVTSPGQSADLMENFRTSGTSDATRGVPPIKGRASVISGDTLWFPQLGVGVRLDGIDACPLPQWAFDPSASGRMPAPAPIPCGALAKAWLKRMVSGSVVNCAHSRYLATDDLIARCFARRRDLSSEMLRVGWARTIGPSDPEYSAAERHARSARYGLWGTYVLDMAEWRRNTVDRTTRRRPIADWSLLAQRKSELTPPFADWRNRPRRTDR